MTEEKQILNKLFEEEERKEKELKQKIRQLIDEKYAYLPVETRDEVYHKVIAYYNEEKYQEQIEYQHWLIGEHEHEMQTG